MENSAKIFKQELALARKDMEEQARSVSRPSRELDDYSTSTVPFLTSRGKEAARTATFKETEATEKQGWLFIRTATGKQGARNTWVRRWFFVRDGMFGSLVLQGQGLKGGGVEETEKVLHCLESHSFGLLLCNIKPAFQEERRFCFEIKTKEYEAIDAIKSLYSIVDFYLHLEQFKHSSSSRNPAGADFVAQCVRSGEKGGRSVDFITDSNTQYACLRHIAPKL
ncbi:hypothetical protein ABW19_dt0210434 [Dactylella cylindrospora]|nr:hypothetical protein ABW19_dt0210434 [Dactylella cylindrospora]